MTLNWPGSSTAFRRSAVSGMALPSNQQLTSSRTHRNRFTTISSWACRTLAFGSILGRRRSKGNVNYLPGTRYGNQPSFTGRASVTARQVILGTALESPFFLSVGGEPRFSPAPKHWGACYINISPVTHFHSPVAFPPTSFVLNRLPPPMSFCQPVPRYACFPKIPYFIISVPCI